ncbi:MAG TPA: phage tail tube protein [Sphingomicrobium sp.]|jgi:hypothetical protein|nr:phage tail tube protein [Sphingomicrobium sp.]
MDEEEVTIGWGGKFFLKDSEGEFIELAEIFETPFPEAEVEDVEKTHMQSPGKRRQFIGGLINDGTGDVLMNYVPGSDTDVLCRSLLSKSTEYKVHLLLADESYYEIAGECVVKQYRRSSPLDDRRTATLTIRFSGDSEEGPVEPESPPEP